MRVAVKKIDGVESVDVSLNRGLAVIRFRPEQRVAVQQVREAIRANGFTPKAAQVRVAGRLVKRGDRLALATPGEGDIFLLAAHADPPGREGDEVVVEGLVPETKRGTTGPLTLEVHMISNRRHPGR